MSKYSASQVSWAPFKNDSGETIPAWGVIRSADATSDSNEESYISAEKPNGTDAKHYINGPFDVAAGEYGSCATTYPVWALVSAEVSPGDSIGPADGSWKLELSGSGFVVVGGYNSSQSIAMVDDGLSGGGTMVEGQVVCDYGDGIYSVSIGSACIDEPSGDCPEVTALDDPCDEWDLCPTDAPACDDLTRSTAASGTTVYAVDFERRRILSGHTVILGRISLGACSYDGIVWRILSASGPLQCLDVVTDVRCSLDCDGNSIIVLDKTRVYYPSTFWICDECPGDPECS